MTWMGSRGNQGISRGLCCTGLLKLWLHLEPNGHPKHWAGLCLCSLSWPITPNTPHGSRRSRMFQKELKDTYWTWLIAAIKVYLVARVVSVLIASVECHPKTPSRRGPGTGGLMWLSSGPCRGICTTLDKVAWIPSQLESIHGDGPLEMSR